jgi:hypothetical protein
MISIQTMKGISAKNAATSTGWNGSRKVTSIKMQDTVTVHSAGFRPIINEQRNKGKAKIKNYF